MRPSLATSVLARFAGAALGAAVFALIAALLDVRGVTGSGVAFWPAFVAVAGLLAPLGVAVAIGIGIARLALVPNSLAGPVLHWFAEEGAPARSRAVAVLLAPLALVLFLLVTARWSLYLLASELPAWPAGSAIALGSMICGVSLAFGVTSLVRASSARELPMPSPAVALGASLAISVAVVALLVATGETSGAGSVFAQFGVLRREELDLRPVGLLLVIAVGASLAPPPSRLWQCLVAFAIGLLPLALTAVAGRTLEDASVALAVERSAPLASKVLAPLRSMTDGDRDGFASRFGGGDCDDRDAARNPGETDVPGNGIDEDCSGADAKPASKPSRASDLPADVQAQAISRLPEQLNVVLITIDTLRWDLGYAGYARPISPRLDEFAAESAVFERAYALASYTAKSLPPMLIGKYCGETYRGYSHFNRFDKRETFIAERLQRAGVRTVSVQGYWYFFQPPFGMERGFDLINASAAPKTAQVEGDKTWNSDKVSDAVIAELGALQDKRFFLWAHYTDPHSEYVEHEGFSFGKDSRARYDSEVAFVDHHVGRVLDSLRKSPAWSRTAVIVTSDHGEAFGEHGMIRHGFELWEELIRVPLLIRVPGLAPRRIGVPRSLIDVVPTLMDLYRLPPASGEGTDFVSGQSLLTDLASAPGQKPRARPIFVDMPEGPHNRERRAYIENDLKLTLTGGQPIGLYDLSIDPQEKQDLSRDSKQVLAALDRFKTFQQTLREVKIRRPK